MKLIEKLIEEGGPNTLVQFNKTPKAFENYAS